MTERMTYARSIELLEGLLDTPALPAKRVQLRRATRLLEELGNPHRSFRSVLIAGSSGKGSTTSMVGSILQHAGFRTGVFRSPHLWSYTERISLDGCNIGEMEWAECFERIWPVVQAMSLGDLPDYELGRPGFFEVLFALSSLYFCDQHVGWAAIEVGMGGRLDATNTLDADVAVITSISLEHTQVLGHTEAEIAREKAAIIKGQSDAVSAVTNSEAREVVIQRAVDVGARLLQVPGDVDYQITQFEATGSAVVLRAASDIFSVSLPLAGAFQACNTATATAAALALQRRGVPITFEDVRRGLETTRIPGRFEFLDLAPPVLLDGAHHPAAAEAFRVSYDELFPGRPFVLLFAAMADKDSLAMARALGPGASRVVVTRVPNSPRGGSPDVQAEQFASVGSSVLTEPDPTLALDRARTLVPRGGLLMVCGSLYLVGLARHLLIHSPSR